MKQKVVGWFSGGVSSFIAIYLIKEQIDEIVFIDIDDHHPDTYRFIKECEAALGKPITTIRHKNYKSVNDVIMSQRVINTPYGSPCTKLLKKQVRLRWEAQQECMFTYVWGYDASETNRAKRIQETMFEYKHIFPLIDAQLTKEEVHGCLAKLEIKRPAMYDLGYSNNNCVGCVKGGRGYWNKIRKDFPEVFKQRAEAERKLNSTCINGIYLDELDENSGNAANEIMEECGIMCELALTKGETK